jgi:hypothetical protein
LKGKALVKKFLGFLDNFSFQRDRVSHSSRHSSRHACSYDGGGQVQALNVVLGMNG